MSHILSAAELKRGKFGYVRQDMPKEGTRLRLLFDLFWRYKGHPVPDDAFRAIIGLAGTCFKLEALRNYGLDIRAFPMKTRGTLIGQEGSHGNKRCYVLVGVWEGSKYLDFVAPLKS